MPFTILTLLCFQTHRFSSDKLLHVLSRFHHLETFVIQPWQCVKSCFAWPPNTSDGWFRGAERLAQCCPSLRNVSFAVTGTRRQQVSFRSYAIAPNGSVVFKDDNIVQESFWWTWWYPRHEWVFPIILSLVSKYFPWHLWLVALILPLSRACLSCSCDGPRYSRTFGGRALSNAHLGATNRP